MSKQHLRTAVALVVCAIVLLASQAARRAAEVRPADDGGAFYRLDEASARLAGVRALEPEARAAGFRFAPGTQEYHRRALLDAVARSRPEARRLVELVDGLVTVRFGQAGADAVGVTSDLGNGSYDVLIDLDGVQARNGARGVNRVIMHELAHVIDSAIVPDDLAAQLDAGIPPGWPCDPGQPEGACAPRAERFAETFAKWATGDIGVDVYLGYKVPPPALEPWGRPLAELGA